jgi:hypothetical protein
VFTNHGNVPHTIDAVASKCEQIPVGCRKPHETAASRLDPVNLTAKLVPLQAGRVKSEQVIEIQTCRTKKRALVSDSESVLAMDQAYNVQTCQLLVLQYILAFLDPGKR